MGEVNQNKGQVGVFERISSAISEQDVASYLEGSLRVAPRQIGDVDRMASIIELSFSRGIITFDEMLNLVDMCEKALIARGNECPYKVVNILLMCVTKQEIAGGDLYLMVAKCEDGYKNVVIDLRNGVSFITLDPKKYTLLVMGGELYLKGSSHLTLLVNKQGVYTDAFGALRGMRKPSRVSNKGDFKGYRQLRVCGYKYNPRLSHIVAALHWGVPAVIGAIGQNMGYEIHHVRPYELAEDDGINNLSIMSRDEHVSLHGGYRR